MQMRKMLPDKGVEVDFDKELRLILEDTIRPLPDGGIFGPVTNPIAMPTGI